MAAELARGVHDAAEEVVARRATARARHCRRRRRCLPSFHTETCTWQPLPVRFGNGFGMKVARRPCFSAIDLTMNLKKHAVGGDQRVVVVPVHLELAVGVLMVVLVGLPAELQHGVADLGDDVVAAHQRLLVVAGLGLAYRLRRRSRRRRA